MQKYFFVPEELRARFAALGDRSALMLKEMQESTILRNVLTKMMSIGWRCEERGNHPSSSCTLAQARDHCYNQNLLTVITACQQGHYHEACAHLDPSDQLMNNAYCSALAERLMNDTHDAQRTAYQTLDAYPAYDVHSHAQTSADLVATSPSFINQDFFALDYDLAAAREQALHKYRYDMAIHEHTVTINRQAEDLVRYYGHDVAPFKHINGNALQHQLLDETAYLIHAAAEYADIKKTELSRLVVDMAAFATDYNHVGSVDKGYACATVGWHVLDTLRLITVGIAQGEHPIEFAAAVFCGKAFLAYQIAQLMVHYGPDVIDYFSNIDYNNLTHEDVIKGFNTIENLCRNEYEALKHKPLNDLIAGGC